MKILHVSCADISGGAGRAAYRLHKSLLSAGQTSEMLVSNKGSGDFTVNGASGRLDEIWKKLRPYFDRFPLIFYPERSKALFSPAWLPFSGIVERIKLLQPDIVHLHWVCEGTMRIEDLAGINVPVVWSLTDMWPFTGGCHYDDNCGRYVNDCGSCPLLKSTKARDLSHRVWSRKRNVYKSLDLTVVGKSRWVAAAASESSLMREKKVVVLPNPIDTAVFSPLEKSLAKKLLNLPLDKKFILFGANEATDDPRKGFKELSAALQIIGSEDVELVIFGSNRPRKPPEFPFKSHYIGNLRDDLSLRILYSAAEVMVVPSLQENLSNAILESLACGTPVVSFNIGGNSDLVDHAQNGYLSAPLDVEDLAKGIIWVLNSPEYEGLCSAAREKVLRLFDSRIVAARYISLYEEILNTRR